MRRAVQINSPVWFLPDQAGRAGWPERSENLRGLPHAGRPRSDHYAAGGRQLGRYRADLRIYAGWSESTFGVKERSGLPQAALNYIKRIEELTGVPIDIISTGPDRTETMILRDPFDA